MEEIQILAPSENIVDVADMTKDERDQFVKSLVKKHKFPYLTLVEQIEAELWQSGHRARLEQPTIHDLLLRKVLHLSIVGGRQLLTPITHKFIATNVRSTQKKVQQRSVIVSKKSESATPAVAASKDAIGGGDGYDETFQPSNDAIDGGYGEIFRPPKDIDQMSKWTEDETSINKAKEQELIDEVAAISRQTTNGHKYININLDVSLIASNTAGFKYTVPHGEIISILGLDGSMPTSVGFATTHALLKSVVSAEQQKLAIRDVKYDQTDISIFDAFIDDELTVAPITGRYPTDIATLKKLYIQLRYLHEYLHFVAPHVQWMHRMTHIQDDIKCLLDWHPKPSLSLSEPLDDKYKILQQLVSVKFPSSAPDAIYATLFVGKKGSIYAAAILSGVDSQATQMEIKKTARENAKSKFDRELNAKIASNQLMLKTYQTIARQKLTAVRFGQVSTKFSMLLNRSPEKFLNLLNDQEKKLIITEYNYCIELRTNKCAHVKLLKKFRIAQTQEAENKSLEELKPFMLPGKQHELITCKVCKKFLICPHVILISELNNQNATFMQFKNALNDFIDRKSKLDDASCRLCGEIIASNYAEVIDTKSAFYDDELKSFIWYEVKSIIRLIKFTAVFDIQKITNAIVESIYPLVFETEKQILKSLTSSSDEIKARKHVFTAIYIFAYLIHIILGSKYAIKFKDHDGSGGIAGLIKYSASAIASLKNIYIRRTVDINIDVIRRRLADAFNAVDSSNAQMETNSTMPITMTAIDPIYLYIYNMHKINVMLHGGKMPMEADVSVMPNLLGELPNGIRCSYQKIKLQLGPKWEIGKIDKLASQNLRFDDKNLDAAEIPYIAGSFMCAIDTFCKLPREVIYSNVGVRVKGDPDPVIVAKLQDPYVRHAENCKNILAIEKMLSLRRQYLNIIPFARANIDTNPPRRFVSKPSHLGRLYDEEGRPHSWDILTDGKNDYTREKYDWSTPIVDIKCSVCGILRSDAHTLNADLIARRVGDKQHMTNLFQYYENRCPLGNTHEGDPCKKCHYAKTREYYEKHVAAYSAAILQTRRDLFSESTQKSDGPEKTENQKSIDFVFDYNKVVELATLLDLNPKRIMAIGSTEQADFESVKNGTFIPSEAESRMDPRIPLLYSYICGIIADYNRVKYFASTAKPEHRITMLMREARESGDRWGELPTKSFHEDFATMSRVKKPREVVNWCLQQLSALCLEIVGRHVSAQADKKERTDLPFLFVKMSINRILHADEMLTKAGEFNKAILYGTKEKRTSESQVEPDTVFEMDDDNEKNKDLMSMESFDVEEDEDDDEPDDDPSNQIRFYEDD